MPSVHNTGHLWTLLYLHSYWYLVPIVLELLGYSQLYLVAARDLKDPGRA